MEYHDSRPGLRTARSFQAIRPLARRICATIQRHKFAVGFLILVVSVLPLLSALRQCPQGDVSHYQDVCADTLSGKFPYRDCLLEYPPYAIPFFLLPRTFGGDGSYPTVFMLTILLADWFLKLSLVALGLRHLITLRSLLPLLFYALAVPAIHFFYLQRYDVWPALICVAALWLFTSGRFTWSGVMIAVGTGVKLYPAVFVPPLLILAFRNAAAKRFCLGLLLGLLPILLLSFFLPWWRFAEFQGSRGLQVESIYASILWSGKFLGFGNVHWASARAWMEVQGLSASAVLPWARAVFATAVIASTAFAIWAAIRLPIFIGKGDGLKTNATALSLISRLLLIPLLAFVVFNQVLSPQYLIWLLPLAALASLEGDLGAIGLIPLATLLTPWFFPTAEYATGLNLTETVILLIRNLMLIVVWLLLLREMYKRAAAPQD